MNRRRTHALLAIALTFLSSCVSVHVLSAPAGADVYVDGELVGKTPCKFKAKTIVGVSYEVIVRKQGYRDFRQVVESEWDPYSLLWILSPLIILTPLLGPVSPRYVEASLEPGDGPAIERR